MNLQGELREGIRKLGLTDVPYEREMKLRSYLTSFLKDRMTRRELLKAGGLTGLSLSALWALACQQAAPAPTPTKAPVAVAPTPTTAPVAVAPTPTKAPAPTPTPEKIGKALIGKLEGPELITDVAKYPKAFKEAPPLADLVKAGKLPPVKERIGEDPLVVKPVHEIGKYGGIWRRGFTGPADSENGNRICSTDKVLFWDYTATKNAPCLAKGWEVGDGGRTITIFLRRGAKWSDGQPFTADDFMFWFEDMFQNKELTPTPTAEMFIAGKPGKMEKVDKYAVAFRFPEPYPMFVDILSGDTNMGSGQTMATVRGGVTGAYAPAHYLKQFHPKYVSKEELDKKAKEAKFDTWVTMFKFKNNWSLNPEVPTMTPWRTTTPINTPAWTLERNPYYWVVDTDGNQLPYLDKIVMTLAENLEVLNLRAIAGEYDLQERHTDLGKIPLFLQNQAKGGYKLHLDPGQNGSDATLFFNQTYEADPEVAKWLTNRDFRRALALGIDRDQLNETFWLGIGTSGSTAPAEATTYSPGPEYRTKWSTYDPKTANEMLDKMGLDKKDGEGYRLRTDGKGRLRLELMAIGAAFMPWPQHAEMIKEHWKKIGIQGDVKEVERGLAFTRGSANEHQIGIWTNGGSELIFLFPMWALPVDITAAWTGPLHATWYATGGQKGKKPADPQMLKALELFRAASGMKPEERVKAGQEIWKILIEEQWGIGTVGQSPALMGVRVVKTHMGNMASRHTNAQHARTPGVNHPATYYIKG